jgi:hypothetical protein
MASEPETITASNLDTYLRNAVGYRVDEPEGCLGFIQGVPHGGHPRRPLVLVVSDDACVHFVSVRRIAAVLPLERRIVLRPREVTPFASMAHDARRRKAA